MSSKASKVTTRDASVAELRAAGQTETQINAILEARLVKAEAALAGASKGAKPVRSYALEVAVLAERPDGTKAFKSGIQGMFPLKEGKPQGRALGYPQGANLEPGVYTLRLAWVKGLAS